MQKLKIAILSYRSAKFGGGQGIYVADISSALSQIGHKVDVISGPPYPDLSNKVNLIKLPGLNLFKTFSFNYRLKQLFKKNSKSFIDYYEFLSVLLGGFPEPKTFGYRANEYLNNNNNYDIIIDNQSLSYGMIEIQSRLPFIEIIHHPITIDYKYELQASKKIKYRISRHRWYSFLNMQKKVAPKIRTIITPSKNSKKEIIKEFKCKENRIHVINNGLDTNQFRPIITNERDKFRLITTASADVPLKGLDFILQALHTLKKEYPKIFLVVIGPLKRNGHTSRLIKKLNLNDNVVFKTNLTRKEIRKLYSKSSIAIVSSLYEGFGYPVIEAMSCGVPLIASNVSSIPELASKYATLVEPGSAEAISNSVKDIISNYDKYNEVALIGREYIIDNFNWIKISNEYENIIYKTIENFRNANI